jgi:hypothetical protein
MKTGKMGILLRIAKNHNASPGRADDRVIRSRNDIFTSISRPFFKRDKWDCVKELSNFFERTDNLQ